MNSEYLKTLYKHDLNSFFRFSFTALHPFEAYMHNWHIDTIAHYLSEVELGEIQKLIINIPPRSLKSECVSVALPAWILGRKPNKKVVCLHSHGALGRELHENTYELMDSQRYKSLFPVTVVKLKNDKLTTSFGGKRQFASFDGNLTGLGADYIIIDDPISTEDARSDIALKHLNEQFDENVLQRLNNKKTGAIILVMQRLHENGLTAHLLAKNDGWVHVNIPAIALEDEIWPLTHGQTYQRKKGEVLHAERDSLEDLQKILLSTSGYSFSYQYLQGQYTPRFGRIGYGALWITPFREGVKWDASNSSDGLHGFYSFTESDFILPRVFNIGNDPSPDNMKDKITTEEWIKGASLLREQMLKRESDRQDALDEE